MPESVVFSLTEIKKHVVRAQWVQNLRNVNSRFFYLNCLFSSVEALSPHLTKIMSLSCHALPRWYA
jgi:hypothetical protein